MDNDHKKQQRENNKGKRKQDWEAITRGDVFPHLQTIQSCGEKKSTAELVKSTV